MTPERYQQINALAEAALALTGDSRQDFLQRACGSDQDLLRGVSGLLQSYQATGGFLEQPALETWAHDAADSAASATLVGRDVDRYLILSHLGSGGIGDVWLAKDHKLTRQVALKLLSADLAGDTEHLRRFRQEARAASRLNHPNLVTIFDIGEFEGRQFIAQEYVEGKTLRNILADGPLPIAAAVDDAAQVAAALATAHAAGIIHRDIKPENIMLRTDGLVKVVDFGLARFLEAAAPTAVTGEHSGITRPGFLIGTIRYMSPEQARGEPVDGRGDIFSLGVVLYEMLTGKSPFAADTPTEVLAAILAREPAPLSQFCPQAPEALARIVRRCLEKDPALRYRSADDLRVDLLRSLPAAAPARPRWLPAAAAVVILVMAASFLVWRIGRTTAAPGHLVLRYSLPLPPGQVLDSLDISPAGDQVVYAAAEGQQKMVYRRFLEEEIARPVAGGEGAEQPFFSPDGGQIGFYTPHSLRIVKGTSWKDLVEVPAEFYLRRAFWGVDGNIYYTSPLPGAGADEAVWRVPAAGGKPQMVLRASEADKGATVFFGQQLSGARWLLCSSVTGPLRRSLERLDLTRLDSPGNAPVRVAEHGMGGQLLPTGHLLYLWGGRLLAARYDDRTAAIIGSPMEVLPDVAINRWFGPKARVSSNGTLAYVRYVMPERRLSWIGPDGSQTPLDLPTAAYVDAEVSPDGTRLAISRQDAQDRWTLWLVDLRTRAWTQLGETNVPLPKALWSPDGKSIVASLAKDNTDFVNLYRIALNDPRNPERLTVQPDFGQYPLSWSAARDAILYVEGTRPGTQSDIFALSLDGRKTHPLVTEPSPDGSPTFSGDGQWFAWSSRLQTGSDIFVQPFDQSRPPRRISAGADPLWSPDGNSLYFLSADGSLMQVPIAAGNPGKAHVIASRLSGLQNGWWSRAYSAAPDGRLLVIRSVSVDSQSQSQIHVVVNWLEEVKRAVP